MTVTSVLPDRPLRLDPPHLSIGTNEAPHRRIVLRGRLASAHPIDDAGSFMTPLKKESQSIRIVMPGYEEIVLKSGASLTTVLKPKAPDPIQKD